MGQGFLGVQFVQVFHSPILELFGYGDARKRFIDHLFQFLFGNGFLPADRAPAFGAMVIRVMKEQGVWQCFDGDGTSRTLVAALVGEFEAAGTADDLMLFLCCHRSAAIATADEAGEGKLMVRLWARTAIASEQRLHLVIFLLSDHRLVLSLMPLAAAGRVFKPAVVEGLGEDFVDGTADERSSALSSGWPRSKGPFRIGDFENPRRSMDAGQHQVPHLPNEGKTLRVLDECVFACRLVRMIEVAKRSLTRKPAIFHLCFEATLDVLAQIVHIFLCHAEFDIHEDDVVILAGIALRRCHHFDVMLLDGPNDGTTVHRITRQAIQFPANDTGGLATVKALHHLIEHRTPRVFCGFGFGENFGHGQIEFRRQLLQFAGL